MTQHLVLDILTTGKSKECGILKIAAVAFDASVENIESGRHYYAEGVDFDSLDSKGYVIPNTFKDTILDLEDESIIHSIFKKNTYSNIHDVMHNLMNYLTAIDILAKGDVKLYVDEIFKTKILLHTLNREFYSPPTWLNTPTVFIYSSDVGDKESFDTFDVLNNVNYIGGKLYNHLIANKGAK